MQLSFSRQILITSKKPFYLFLILFTLNSCLDEFQSEQVIVLTEEILELTSEEVTLLGRLVTTTDQPTEVGFYLDVEESFGSPIILSSINEPSIGFFTVKDHTLNPGTHYYTKAYVKISNELFFGEAISFVTSVPAILNIEPLDGEIGDEVRIQGLNITDDVEVFFGDKKADITLLRDKSELIVSVPDIGTEIIVGINLVMKGTSYIYKDEFTYRIGSWESKSQISTEDQLIGCVFFITGDNLIVGYGRDFFNAGTINQTFYSYNVTNDNWTVFSDPEQAIPVSNPINYGFGFGSGTSGEIPGAIVQTKQSWAFDHVTSTWTANGDLTIEGLSSAIYANLNGIDFFFGGLLSDRTISQKIWKGDLESGEFVSLGTSPYSILSDEAYFIYNEKFYYQSDEFTIVGFDPQVEEWTDFLSSDVSMGSNNIAVKIKNKVLLGLGIESSSLFEIDLIDQSMIEKNKFIGSSEESNVAFCVYEEKLYVLRTGFSPDSRGDDIERMVIWEFNPDELRQL